MSEAIVINMDSDKFEAQMLSKKYDAKQIVIDIDHKFSDHELKELSRQIVALDAEIDSDENEMEVLKGDMKVLRESIESKDTERRKLSRKYSAGMETRSIPVKRVIDYDTSLIKYYDIDTMVLIKAEPLNENGLFDKQNRNDEEWN